MPLSGLLDKLPSKTFFSHHSQANSDKESEEGEEDENAANNVEYQMDISYCKHNPAYMLRR